MFAYFLFLFLSPLLVPINAINHGMNDKMHAKRQIPIHMSSLVNKQLIGALSS
jgi:hypothetical protein